MHMICLYSISIHEDMSRNLAFSIEEYRHFLMLYMQIKNSRHTFASL